MAFQSFHNYQILFEELYKSEKYNLKMKTKKKKIEKLNCKQIYNKILNNLLDNNETYTRSHAIF